MIWNLDCRTLTLAVTLTLTLAVTVTVALTERDLRGCERVRVNGKNEVFICPCLRRWTSPSSREVRRRSPLGLP